MAYNQTFTYLPNIGYLLVDGTVEPSTSYRHSDHIPVVSGADYRLTNSGTTPTTLAVCYYDVDGDFIIGVTRTATYGAVNSTAPLNARTVKISMRTGYEVTFTQLTKLDELPEPEPTFNHVLTQADVNLFNSNNVVLYVDDVLINVGDGFNIDSQIKFKPKNGYQIQSITYRDADGFPDQTFTISADGLSATDVYDGVSMDSYTFLVKKSNGTTDPDPVDPDPVDPDPVDPDPVDPDPVDPDPVDPDPVDPDPVDPEPEPDYVWTQSKIDALENVIFTINGVLVVDGMGMFIGDVMKVTAVGGYEIVSAGYRDMNGFNISFIVAGDYKSASLTWADVDDFNGFSVDTRFVQETDVAGYNDIYRVTDEQMREVATASFEFFNGQTTVDYGKYIIGAIDLPFEIRENQITGLQNISLGESTTGINAELLATDTLRVDMGSIFVPLIKNNLLDFANTLAVLHLPYAESVIIDIDYVIGETISIEYIVSLYDGLAIINISSSKIDGIINTRNVDLNVSIPFGNIDSNPSNNDPKNVELGGDNGIKTPHIEILRNDAVLENGFFTIPVVDETLLIEQNGFVKIDEIDLKVKASKDEKEMILNAINQGVIIK